MFIESAALSSDSESFPRLGHPFYGPFQVEELHAFRFCTEVHDLMLGTEAF